MKVVVSAKQEGLDAQVSPVFGRCPVYVFVDTDTMQSESATNPAMSAPGGAGIQAAQFAVSKGATAALAGNVGPNAFNVLQAAGVAIYPVSGGTVRQVVEALKSGQLLPISGATSAIGAGMGGGREEPWAPETGPHPPLRLRVQPSPPRTNCRNSRAWLNP